MLSRTWTSADLKHPMPFDGPSPRDRHPTFESPSRRHAPHANPGPNHPMPLDDPSQADQPMIVTPNFQEIAPQFSQLMDAYAPHSVQLPDGNWFEQRPLPSPIILSVAEKVGTRPTADARHMRIPIAKLVIAPAGVPGRSKFRLRLGVAFWRHPEAPRF